MIEHERVLAAMQTQADTIARLERELAEARAKIEGLTVDEDWTKDDHVAMVNEANAQLQAFASGLEANLAAVIQRAEAAEEVLRALAKANAAGLRRRHSAPPQNFMSQVSGLHRITPRSFPPTSESRMSLIR